MRNFVLLLGAAASLSGCMSSPKTYQFPDAAPTARTPPPQQAPVVSAPSTATFRAPTVMNMPGLEGVIGRDATALANIFGPPRLEVKEGDAMKLQFTGNACVLDIYLYPLSPGARPSATHVEARRASDGEDVDRAACVRALRR